MFSGGPAKKPFQSVLVEFALAGAIILAHGLLAILWILVGAVVHKVLEIFSGAHEPTLWGVSARDIIDGADIALIAVVLVSGIVSAIAIFIMRLYQHMRD